MLAASQKCLKVVSSVSKVGSIARWTSKPITHASISCLTTSITSGRGDIVSKLPRGIWRTRFMALGTTVTILEPLSTRRFSHGAVNSGAWVCNCLPIPIRGAKCESWAVVVKITNDGAMQKEVTPPARLTYVPSPAAYSLLECARPTNIELEST
jgi:hypothetical protein